MQYFYDFNILTHRESYYYSQIMFVKNIIEQAKHDPKAFSLLYEKYVTPVYRYVEFRCNNSADAEDITGTIWETVLKNIGGLKSGHPAVFQAWLYSITKNTLNLHYRDGKKRPEVLADNMIDSLPSTNDTPHQAYVKKSEKQQFKILVNSLPPRQKEIIRMRHLLDLRNKDIAKIMDIDPKTVAANYCRALKFLRKTYNQLNIQSNE